METKKKLNDDKMLADTFVKQSDNLDDIINGLSHITKHKEQMDQSIESLSFLTSNISKLDSEKKLTMEKRKNLISQLAIIEDKIKTFTDDYESSIQTPPLGNTPMPIVQTARANVNPNTNLTRTQTALLSPEEQVIASRRQT